jgi:hypothetical protein
MPSETLAKYGTLVSPTITLTSLANGAGRVSDAVDNTTVRAPACMVYFQVTTGGSAPTANTPIKLYLIRRSNQSTDIADSNLGTTDAAVTVEPTNAEQVGSVVVTNATNTSYYKSFLVYDLPAKYSFVVWNATGQALNSTAGNFVFQVVPVTMEAQ